MPRVFSIGARQRGLLVLLLASAALATPAVARATLQPATIGSDYVELTNSQGTFRIYTRCNSSGAGPGYIAYATHDNRVLIDDTSGGQQDTAGGQGIRVPQGLGKFVFREARAAFKTPLGGSNTFLVDGKYCAGAGAIGVNDDPAYTHQIGGVETATQADGTPLSETVRVMVTFRDAYIPQFLTVTYVWRFWDTYVQLWSDVIENCSGPVLSANSNTGSVLAHGSCGAPDAWIKGPKYVVGLGSYNGTFPGNLPWTTISTYSTSRLRNQCSYSLNGADTGSGLGWQCPIKSRISKNQLPDDPVSSCGVAPDGKPGWCWTGNPDQRAWVQFQSSGGGCVPDCFNAVVRAYPPNDRGTYYPTTSDPNDLAGITPGQQALNWIGSGYGAEYFGMDQWAQNEDLMPAENEATSAGCTHPGSSAVDQVYPYDYNSARLWEALGDKYTSPPQYLGPTGGNWAASSTTSTYTYAGYYFFAWRDCIDVPSDPRAFRATEGTDTNYGTYASFSFTTSPTAPPPAMGG